VKALGYKPSQVITQFGQYIICIGAADVDIRKIGNLDGVKDVHMVSDQSKLVSRMWRVRTTEIPLGDGVVIKSARDYKYGRYVTIKHAKGYETKYAHLNVSYVKAGTIVYSGDVIGEMGKTGVTTGVHLHYEVIRNNKILNPYSYVNNSLRKIAKKNSVI